MFLVNNLDHTLTLKSGYLQIPTGGSAPISEVDLSEPTIADAVSRRWAEISDVEVFPKDNKAKEVAKPTNPYEGLTLEQMKAEQAAKEVKPEAITTRLGQDPVVTSPGGTSESIGQPPVVAPVEVVPEEAKKAAKNSKAKE